MREGQEDCFLFARANRDGTVAGMLEDLVWAIPGYSAPNGGGWVYNRCWLE
jgi:hypothetical protein